MNKVVGSILLLIVGYGLFAQEEESLLWKGYFQPDHRLNLNNGDWLWNENRLSLQFSRRFEEKAKITTDIWVRTLGLPNEQQWIKIPEIREAKIEVYDFLISKLDLAIGRQRIKWGSADKINPTDNLNAYDLEDIWDFGRHKPADAIHLKYYPGEKTKIEAAFMPLFQRMQMPIGVYSDLLMPEFTFPDSMEVKQKPGYPPLPFPSKVGIVVDTFSLSYVEPSLNIEHAAVAFKIAHQIEGIDVSASYVYGYDGIPAPSNAFITVDSLNFLQNRTYISVNTKLIYPRFHRIGLDFTGSIKGVGVWGEACLTMPDKDYLLHTHTPDLNALMGIDLGLISDVPDSIIFQKNKPWLKYVLGMDYTFENGIYTNFQYVHGFFHERGKEELNDYFLLRMEKRLLNDKLKIAPISGGLVINDFKDVKNNYAIMWMPEFAYYPNDNTELTIGVKVIDGKGTGTFNKLKDLDEVFFKVKYSF